MTNFKLIFLFTILFYIKYAVCLQYLPPDRKVEVVQGGSYRIGVEDVIDLDIVKCHFTGNTGLNCSFEVWPTRGNDNPNPIYCNYNGTLYAFENTVTEHGRQGLCQITVGMVEDTGPANWTLIAQNFDGEIAINDTFDVHFFYKATLVKYEIRVLEFANFLNHMTGFGFDDLVSCNVRYNDTIIPLDLHSTRTNTYLGPYSKESEEISSRLSSLGFGLCGFKYINATTTIWHLEWTLTATHRNGRDYRQSFDTRIVVRPPPENMHSRRTVYWGMPVEVPCGPSPAGNYLCSMFNPRGEPVETLDCRYKITSFSMNDVGLWKCYSGSLTTMESLEYTVEYIGRNPETIEIWNYETDTYLNMGCKTANVVSSIQYCKMIAPNQRLFILQPHVITDRYLSLGTDINNGVCALQIKKPLQEYEKGRWLCEIGISYQDPTGSAIMVGTTNDASYPKHLKMTTQLNEKLKLHCVVPYFTEYCRIRAPNGTLYPSTSANQVRLGTCMMEIPRVNISDNGTWVCLFGRNTGEPDDEITVDVTVAEVLQYYKFVEIDYGDSAELMCSSGGLPLKYCRFIAPNGKGYQIQEYTNSSTISYYGRGLNYGDCGIKIEKTQTRDKGYWTCVTEIISARPTGEISARTLLDVTETGPNFAAISVGTAVGLILVGSIVGMVVVRRWRRRRHDEVPGTTTTERGINTDDNLSQSSGESNIFSMGPPPRLYVQDEDAVELQPLET